MSLGADEGVPAYPAPGQLGAVLATHVRVVRRALRAATARSEPAPRSTRRRRGRSGTPNFK